MNNDQEIKYIDVPLKVEELKEFIENKTKYSYFINYQTSELKDLVLLNYISNLELPAEIIMDNCSYDEKAGLLKAYMDTRNIVKIDSLALNVAKILLDYRGLDTTEIFNRPYFDQNESKQFINDHKELIQKWEHFLESTIIFAQSCVKELNELLKIKEDIEVINDSRYVGSNIVNLFSIPSFSELFFLVPLRTELKYFRPQFEERMFKGRSFYDYYFCQQNDVLNMFLAHIENDITRNDMNAAYKEAQAILMESNP